MAISLRAFLLIALAGLIALFATQPAARLAPAPTAAEQPVLNVPRVLVAVPPAGVASRPASRRAMILLEAQNGSGEAGSAELTDSGNGLIRVDLVITNAPAGVAQPAHIHRGSCAQLDPQPAYPLSDVKDGLSTTVIKVALTDLLAGHYAINVHKSAAQVSVYVACGDLSAAPQVLAATAPPTVAPTSPTAAAKSTAPAALTAAAQPAAPMATAKPITPATPTATTKPAAPAPAAAPIKPTVATPAPAPNLGGMLAYVAGGKIVAQAQGQGNPTILVADPTGGGGNPLPAGLRWSPTGRLLLYTVAPATGPADSRIYVYDFDTRRLADLGLGRDPAWNAAGDRVALVRSAADGSGRIAVVTVATGHEEALGPGYTPAWMPDGKQIAVTRGSDIWLLAYPAGGGERQLTHLGGTANNPWYISALQYHYTGRLLFFGGQNNNLGAQLNGQQLFAVSLANGRPAALSTGGGNGAIDVEISPDGRYVAVADQTHGSACVSLGGVTVVDTTSGRVTGVPLPADDTRHVHMHGVSWAPMPTSRLAVAYSEYSCASSGAGPQEIAPSRIYLVDLAAPDRLQRVADGAGPAWNRGHEALGALPALQEAALR